MFRERAAKSLTRRALAGVGESSPQREVLAVGDRERRAQLADLFGVPPFEFLELRGRATAAKVTGSPALLSASSAASARALVSVWRARAAAVRCSGTGWFSLL